MSPVVETWLYSRQAGVGALWYRDVILRGPQLANPESQGMTTRG